MGQLLFKTLPMNFGHGFDLASEKNLNWMLTWQILNQEMCQKSFSAFVRFIMIQERIITPKRRNGNFIRVVLAPLAESMQCQMGGGSIKTEMQT